MVLGIGGVGPAGERADRQVEPRRVVLALVVAEGHKILHVERLARIFEHPQRRTVGDGVPAPGSLIVQPPRRIPQTGGDQPVADPLGLVLVL